MSGVMEQGAGVKVPSIMELKWAAVLWRHKVRIKMNLEDCKIVLKCKGGSLPRKFTVLQS